MILSKNLERRSRKRRKKKVQEREDQKRYSHKFRREKKRIITNLVANTF
jgi:hypothetical protein